MSVMATSFVEAMIESVSSPKVVALFSVLPHVSATAHEFLKYMYCGGASVCIYSSVCYFLSHVILKLVVEQIAYQSVLTATNIYRNEL